MNNLNRIIMTVSLLIFTGVGDWVLASDPHVDDQKLLCARIGMATMSVEPKAQLSLEHLASEGGSANVYVMDNYVRIQAGLLNESVREHMDYRYQDDQLICAESETTSIWTIQEQSKSNPSGRPPFWRKDFRLYHGKKVFYENVDQAPGEGHDSRDAKATQKFADKLRKLANKELSR